MGVAAPRTAQKQLAAELPKLSRDAYLLDLVVVEERK